MPAGVAHEVRGTDFVLFAVSDLDRAAKFYRDVPGLPQEVYSEEWQWAEFNCGNVTLSLKGGESVPQAGSGGQIALAVDDVQVVCEDLKQRGVRVGTGLQDFGCCQTVEVFDPEGNRVILRHRADGTFGPNPPSA